MVFLGGHECYGVFGFGCFLNALMLDSAAYSTSRCNPELKGAQGVNINFAVSTPRPFE